MALNADELDLLRRIYGNLNPLEALPPGDPRYEPIYQTGDREDPVARLRTHVEWNEIESLQLFSGFRGSGKTTELYRLRAQLEGQGKVVVYANALDYVNPSEPIDISDLLLVLAGAFSEGLETELKIDLGAQSFWQQIKDYLHSKSLSVTEATAGLAVETPAKEVLGGLKAGLEVKFALKETGTFRQKLRQFLQNRLPELKAEVNRFFEEGVKAIRERKGENTSVVFIFDQLEQLRGSVSNEMEVIKSVERVFASHLDKLRFPYVHAIYTVPPWLQFVLPGGTQMEILPTFRLWENDGKRSPSPEGLKAMRAIAKKRFGDGYARVFGGQADMPSGHLDSLIAASGGHFRDLFLLLRELLVRIQTESQSLPVDEAVVEKAIQRVREQYLPLAEEDASRLAEIERTRALILRRASPDEAARISRLLDLHFVLYFSNGGDWYDIHPLIRGEVDAVVKRLAPPMAAVRGFAPAEDEVHTIVERLEHRDKRP